MTTTNKINTQWLPSSIKETPISEAVKKVLDWYKDWMEKLLVPENNFSKLTKEQGVASRLAIWLWAKPGAMLREHLYILWLKKPKSTSSIFWAPRLTVPLWWLVTKTL